jgi:hypothetical protein
VGVVGIRSSERITIDDGISNFRGKVFIIFDIRYEYKYLLNTFQADQINQNMQIEIQFCLTISTHIKLH